MRIQLTILVIFALVFLTSSHPTYYKVDRNITCVNPNPAPIFSWHIHVLYWNKNANHTAGAYAIRDKFHAAFKDRLDAPCTDLFHQQKLCMFNPDGEAIGPFLTAQWAVFVTTDDFADVIPWFIQNRGNYDVLIHPNTGCELEDHSSWAAWAGNPWEIDLEAFGHDFPWPWPGDEHPDKLRPLPKNDTESLQSLVQELLKKQEKFML